MSAITFPDAALRHPSGRQQPAGSRTPGYTSSAAPSLFDHDPEKSDTAHLDNPSAVSIRNSPLPEEPNWPKEVKAWTTLAACFFLMFNSWGLVNAYGTFASYYKDVLLPDADALYFNLFGATDCFMVLILSGVVGRLLDAGYYRYLIGVGTFLVTLSFMMLSISNGGGEWEEGSIGLIWLTHGFLAGLGMSCFFVSSSQTGLIYPIMLRFLTTSIGFNNAVRCVAGLIGLTALFSLLFAVPNPKHIYRKPESWKDHRVWVDFEAFRYKPFVWFTASISFLFLGFYPVFFNLEEWAANRGFGYKEGILRTSGPGQHKPLTAGLATYYMLAIMNAMSTFGRIGAAWASDHYGAVQVHTVVTGVCSLLVLVLWTLTPNFKVTMVFISFFGVFSGSVIGLPPASMAYILGKEPHRQSKLGQWTGMMYTAAGIPSLIGPIIAGSLISKFDTYLTVQLWSGACLLLSTACMAVTVLYKRREAAGTYTPNQSDGSSDEEGPAATDGFRIGRATSTSNNSSRTVSSGVSSVREPRHHHPGAGAGAGGGGGGGGDQRGGQQSDTDDEITKKKTKDDEKE
ncbi:hypothetical protein SLS56_004709 [Neofusicoccum ribis]|uniref:MFS general substrate transporter n=1 Tax=Neofusicoccum ribis TaxID=45134 RepID=A0ABR3SVF8_9PEZI